MEIKCKPGWNKIEVPRHKSKNKPEAKKALPQYICAPIISPPLQVHSSNIIEWEIAIQEYNSKREQILGKALSAKIDRIYYLGSEEELTKTEKKTIKEFEISQAHNKLFDIAKKLFDKAFKYDKAKGKIISVDQKAKNELISFLGLIQKKGVGDSWVRYLARLNNKELALSDLGKILDLENCDQTQKNKKWEILSQTIKELAKEKFLAYEKSNGKIDPEKSIPAKRLEAILWALNVSGQFDVAASKVIGRMLFNQTQEELPDSTKRFFSNYRKVKAMYLKAARQGKGGKDSKIHLALTKMEQALFLHLLSLQQRLYMSPYSSRERIHFYRAQQAAYYAAIASGISEKKIGLALSSYNLPMPKDSDRKKEFLSIFNKMVGISSYISASPETSDNYKVIPLYKKALTEAVQSYVKCASYEECEAIGIFLHALLGFRDDLGIPKEQIAGILSLLQPKSEFVEVTAKARILISSMPANYSPRKLPIEIKEIIKELGAWDNLILAQRITFVRSIHRSEFDKGTFEIGGHASRSGIITIDTTSCKTAEEIALILVHEARHIRDMQNNPKISSTQTERNAYLAGYKAGQKILVSMIKKRVPPERIKGLASLVAMSKASVEYANRILGYPENDFSERADLPRGKDMDYTYYPVFEGYQLEGATELALFLRIKPKLLKDLFKQILSNGKIFDGKIVTNKKGDRIEKCDYKTEEAKSFSLFFGKLRKYGEGLYNKFVYEKSGPLSFNWRFGKDELKFVLRFARVMRLAEEEIFEAKRQVVSQKDKPLISIP